MGLTSEKMTECLGRLTLLKRFPANRHAVAEVARILSEVCGDDDQATGAVDRILNAHDEWMGPAAFRQACKGAPKPTYWDPRTITG